jgi:hypothetical protein
MEGFIAVLGFWLSIIVFILRRPITELILAKKKTLVESDSVQVTQLETRIHLLEEQLYAVNREMHELREANEFTTKLLTNSGKVVATHRVPAKV